MMGILNSDTFILNVSSLAIDRYADGQQLQRAYYLIKEFLEVLALALVGRSLIGGHFLLRIDTPHAHS
jgi:hypothetical protein